jgi:hypothetical protein
MAEGSGSWLRDVDGHEYVDYLPGLGPMILGHRHPVVTPGCLAVLDEIGGFGRAVEVAGGSAADPFFRRDLADATRRAASRPHGGDTHCSARGAALIAALAVGATGRTQRFPTEAWPPSPTKPGPGGGTSCGPPTSPPVAGFTPRPARPKLASEASP